MSKRNKELLEMEVLYLKCLYTNLLTKSLNRSSSKSTRDIYRRTKLSVFRVRAGGAEFGKTFPCYIKANRNHYSFFDLSFHQGTLVQVGTKSVHCIYMAKTVNPWGFSETLSNTTYSLSLSFLQWLPNRSGLTQLTLQTPITLQASHE